MWISTRFMLPPPRASRSAPLPHLRRSVELMRPPSLHPSVLRLPIEEVGKKSLVVQRRPLGPHVGHDAPQPVGELVRIGFEQASEAQLEALGLLVPLPEVREHLRQGLLALLGMERVQPRHKVVDVPAPFALALDERLDVPAGADITEFIAGERKAPPECGHSSPIPAQLSEV